MSNIKTAIFTQEVFVNRTKGYRYYDSPWEETGLSSLGEVYRRLARDYGRCESKMYIDGKDGEAIQVGWVFEKMVSYDDYPNQKFLREAWVQYKIVRYDEDEMDLCGRLA